MIDSSQEQENPIQQVKEKQPSFNETGDRTPAAPTPSTHFIKLPKTTLHYVKCGEGPPLVMVPATISLIENWLALVQFMGTRFTTYFFELPGHGKSSPLPQAYSGELVAESVENFIDALGYDTISLMGFSFGGILAMKTLFRLQDRIEKVILFGPAVSNRAMHFSKTRLFLLQTLTRIVRDKRIRQGFLRLIHDQFFNKLIAATIKKYGNIEKQIALDEVLLEISATTLEVLTYQMHEIMYLEYPEPEHRFNQPCYFGMSVIDPLLDFDITLDVVQKQFEHVHLERFNFPYHQPPKAFTFEELMRDFSPLLDLIPIEPTKV